MVYESLMHASGLLKRFDNQPILTSRGAATKKWIHTDRIACGDYDHRNSCKSPVLRICAGERDRAGDKVQKQFEAVGTGIDPVHAG